MKRRNWMKKCAASLLALLLTCSLAACGGGSGSGSGDSGGSAGGDSGSGGEKTYRVAFILNSSINDGGWGTASLLPVSLSQRQ